MINFCEHQNINNKTFVDDVFTNKINEKIYKISLKKNKLYYFELIPDINFNLYLRLYDNNEQIIKINNNIIYDDYYLIGNQEYDIIDDNDNDNIKNNNVFTDDNTNSKINDDSNLYKYNILNENTSNNDLVDNLNDKYIDYINDILIESGINNGKVSYDENNNTFYIDLLVNNDSNSNNLDNTSNLKNNNYDNNKLNINKNNINNYNIDLVVDNYEKDIFNFLDDIDKDIYECDKKIYYKPTKNEDIYILITTDNYFEDNINYKLKIKEVEPIDDNIYTKLKLNKSYKNLISSQFNINKYKFFLKKNIIYSISINNCIDDISMILYNKNYLKNFYNKKSINFKVDKGGYYYLDIFSENYKQKFIYDIIIKSNITNKNLGNILTISNK
jgi:hypothetical protein